MLFILFETCFAKGVFYVITIMNRLIIVENYICYFEKDINNRVDESAIGESGTTHRIIASPDTMQ